MISMHNYFFQAPNCMFSRKQHFKPVIPHPPKMGPEQCTLLCRKAIATPQPMPPNPKINNTQVLKMVGFTIIVQISQGAMALP